MSNYIIMFYMVVITYPCPNPDICLPNLWSTVQGTQDSYPYYWFFVVCEDVFGLFNNIYFNPGLAKQPLMVNVNIGLAKLL